MGIWMSESARSIKPEFRSNITHVLETVRKIFFYITGKLSG